MPLLVARSTHPLRLTPTIAISIALAAAGGILAVAAGRASFQFFLSLDLPKPPLSGFVPDSSAEMPHRRLSQRVFMVIVDGLRLDASTEQPFFDPLRARGAAGQATSHFPSLSLPNYVSIVTGVDPLWSGVRTNESPHRVHLDSMMAKARAAGLHVRYLSDQSASIPKMFPKDLDGGGVASWPGGFEAAASEAVSGNADLVVLLTTTVDNEGHSHGARSPQYRRAVSETAQQLARIFRRFDFSKDTIVLAADHGHTNAGGHGGTEKSVMQIPLIFAGAGIQPGPIPEGARLIDIAPTVSALLGVPAPMHARGRALGEILRVSDSERQALAVTDATRHSQLKAYALNKTRAQVRAARRLWLQRGAILLLAITSLLFCAIGASRARLVCLDRRSVAIGLGAFPVVLATLVAVFGGKIPSPSSVPTQDMIAGRLVLHSAVAGLVVLALAWWALAKRHPPRSRLAAASGLVLCGLIVALTSGGLVWTFANPTLPLLLASPQMLVLPSVIYWATAWWAVAAAALLVLENIIFGARTL